MQVCRPVSDPPVSTRWLLSLSKTPCKTLYCTLLHRKPFWSSFALQVSTVTHSLYGRRWLVCEQSPTTGHSAASLWLQHKLETETLESCWFGSEAQLVLWSCSWTNLRLHCKCIAAAICHWLKRSLGSFGCGTLFVTETATNLLQPLIIFPWLLEITRELLCSLGLCHYSCIQCT